MALVYLSLGSNIDRQQRIAAALDALADHFGSLQISSVYESEAVGFEGDNFFNLVVGIHTDLSVGELSRVLRQVEADNGRRRGGPNGGEKKYSARTLDIDILTYDQCFGDVDGISLPRGEITKHAFVLLPLKEIAPADIHAATGKSYQQLWEAFDRPEQKLWPVAFDWQGNALPCLR